MFCKILNGCQGADVVLSRSMGKGCGRKELKTKMGEKKKNGENSHPPTARANKDLTGPP